MECYDLSHKSIELKSITKRFGNFTANENISLAVHKGEVHALLGENGAGKSTLMNILYGLYPYDEGEIYIHSKQVSFKSPLDAISHGVGMVHQHFMLISPFTVAENIVLGAELTIKKSSFLDYKVINDEINKLSKAYGMGINATDKIKDIGVALQQRVEILKVLYRNSDVIIFDEPTAVLTPQEIESFQNIVRLLAKEGKSIIFITHKLKEIKACADFCTIIRSGKHIKTVNVSDTSEIELASLMVGRSVSFKTEKIASNPKESALKIENLVVENSMGVKVVDNLSLEVRKGEIVGIAGVSGNGQKELVEAIYGLNRVKSGKILLEGEDITNIGVAKTIEKNIAFIPEDRHHQGLVLPFTTAYNIVLKEIDSPKYSNKLGFINSEKIISDAIDIISNFGVQPPDPNKPCSELSGGNQQKVILGREISNSPIVLIAFQPTRGLDVGSIEYIHKNIIAQRDSQKAILLISLELDEIFNLADKVAVISKGYINKVMDAHQTNENEVGFLMAGGKA